MHEKIKKMKSAYPHIRIGRKTHDFLRQECADMDAPSITEFVELLLETYKENREAFNEFTGGVIGNPKQSLFNPKNDNKELN